MSEEQEEDESLNQSLKSQASVESVDRRQSKSNVIKTKLVEMSKKLSKSTDDLLDSREPEEEKPDPEPAMIKPNPVKKKDVYDASLFIKVLRLKLFGDNESLKAEKTLKVTSLLPLLINCDDRSFQFSFRTVKLFTYFGFSR